MKSTKTFLQFRFWVKDLSYERHRKTWAVAPGQTYAQHAQNLGLDPQKCRTKKQKNPRYEERFGTSMNAIGRIQFIHQFMDLRQLESFINSCLILKIIAKKAGPCCRLHSKKRFYLLMMPGCPPNLLLANFHLFRAGKCLHPTIQIFKLEHYQTDSSYNLYKEFIQIIRLK